MSVSGQYCPFCQSASKLAVSDPNFDIHEHVIICLRARTKQIDDTLNEADKILVD